MQVKQSNFCAPERMNIQAIKERRTQLSGRKYFLENSHCALNVLGSSLKESHSLYPKKNMGTFTNLLDTKNHELTDSA